MAGCMPQMASLFRNQFLKALSSFSFKDLKARLVYYWSRRSKGGSAGKPSHFARVGSNSGREFYLETRIQGSIQGNGEFLDSGVHPQQQWIDRSFHEPPSQGAATVREMWDD